MNTRQRKTVQQLFERPERSDIRWNAIESLLLALGAEMTQGSGSRVAFDLGDETLIVHRPHPQPTMDKGAIKSIRRFLQESGVQP